MPTMTEPGKVFVICDGQFGSTGKGLIAAAVGETETVDIATTNASANAGHTARWKDGRKVVVSHLPMAGVVNPNTLLYLNAGSIIDPVKLIEEISDNGVSDRLIIHPNATIIAQNDRDIEAFSESGAAKISSTQKGVGAALARKIKRDAKLARDHEILAPFIGEIDLNERLSKGAHVVMEVPQGFSLGYHTIFYPYCTSRQCTPAQGLADAQISPYFLGRTLMTLRTYPIRVGSLPGTTSGGWYMDQKETTWEEIGVEPELTTVTQRIRRVANFSSNQYYRALQEIRPDILFINFMNYLKEEQIEPFRNRILMEYKTVFGMEATPHCLWGYGPNLEDIRNSHVL